MSREELALAAFRRNALASLVDAGVDVDTDDSLADELWRLGSDVEPDETFEWPAHSEGGLDSVIAEIWTQADDGRSYIRLVTEEDTRGFAYETVQAATATFARMRSQSP
jgi:hypothetical protein